MASALYSSLKQKAGGLLQHLPLHHHQQKQQRRHQQRLKQSPYIEGEIVYSKNNVCVHAEGPVAMETAHHAGYLCVQCRQGDFLLKWTPNRRLSKQASDTAEADKSSPTSPTSSTASWTTADSGDSDEARKQQPAVFHCNLMRVRRVLLSAGGDGDDDGGVEDSGHAVIQSGEWQLKLLHFHRGGLRRLADLLDSRPDAFRRGRHPPRYFAYSTTSPQSPPPLLSSQFGELGAAFSDGLFPSAEETADDSRPPLTLAELEREFADSAGGVEDESRFRRAVFLGGVAPSARRQLWPLVIGLYPAGAGACQRRHLGGQLEARLAEIRQRRLALTGLELAEFHGRVTAPVERDVCRTDRDQAFYSGPGPRAEGNVARLRDLLLDFAFDNPDLGYAQAMTELLSPLLIVLDSDAEAYWCFHRLVRAGHFFSAPTDAGMDGQLEQLRDLLRLMRPGYYEYCRVVGDPDLLYCHRWMILCFKREFPLEETLRVWEACWAHCATDYFHLFLCLAVIDVYGDFCVEKRLPADETLMYFSQLAGRMEAGPLLARARRLLARFRALPWLPCSLASLCHRCGTGMWDSGHLPTVRCPEGPHACSYLR